MVAEALLDPLDRRIVVALQIDGRASWTEIAELCGTSITTVARRGQQLISQGTVRVAVVPDINHGGPADLYILRIGCAPGTQIDVCMEMARREDLRFLSLVTGSCDIVAELNTLKEDSLQSRLVDEIEAIDGVQRCETDLLIHTYKVARDWSRQLLTGDAQEDVAEEPHECDASHFDETDRKMLALMKDDGRASFRSVADALGMNESTIRRRFETLRANGCITVTTLVPAASLGFQSEILLWITAAPPLLDTVARKLSRNRGVRYVGATLNGSCLMCELILPTTDDVFEFTTGILGRLEGVQGWTANVELVTFRRGFVETPSSRKLMAERRQSTNRVKIGGPAS